ncbi:hypothetical protein [Desulfofalx alkaliphila]|uniref:hypothetical protein n=1 Tax=Desulfofalx alkaliphila TaxID=105483 RepID=UPI0004E15F62|nr:hypothetical protein [Desulfofalx alkaliphila]
MQKYVVRGPGRNCEEIQADNLQRAVQRVQQMHPQNTVTADATEVIYVCQPNENETTCQMKLNEE